MSGENFDVICQQYVAAMAHRQTLSTFGGCHYGCAQRHAFENLQPGAATDSQRYNRCPALSDQWTNVIDVARVVHTWAGRECADLVAGRGTGHTQNGVRYVADDRRTDR